MAAGCTPKRVPTSQYMQSCRHAAVNIDERDVSKIRKQSNECKINTWVDGFVARHYLCPWAAQAAKSNDIKVVVSDACHEEALLKTLQNEAAALMELKYPRLATTLVACTGAWALDFARFDEFVETTDVSPTVNLVCFHPSFSRWPDWDVKVGDAVLSYHWQNYGGVDELFLQQAEDGENVVDTDQRIPAVQAEDEEEIDEEEIQDENMDKDRLLQACKEIDNTLLKRTEAPSHGVVLKTEDDIGVREVQVRFEHGDEVIPVDWIVSKECDKTGQGGLLADNFIHRSPLPIVHLLRDDSLAEVLDDVGEEGLADLQWRNADLMRRAARILRRVP